MRMKNDADGRLTSFGYFGYDASRRPTTVSFSTDPWEYFTYDSLGSLTQTTDETGATAQAFDSLGRMTKKTTLAGTVYYAYGKSGRRIQSTTLDPQNTLSGTYYGYDAAGRLNLPKTFDSTGVRTTITYFDASGLVTQKWLPSNQVVSYYTYDSAGRISKLRNQDSSGNALSYFEYTRNENGSPTKTYRETGVAIYFAYDALDRTTQEVWKSSAGATVYGWYYNFDAASNRYFQYDCASGVATYYSYDARNLLSQDWSKP